jgi:hypothetical protein
LLLLLLLDIGLHQLDHHITVTFTVCRSLGGVHGIPKVHYKGRQGDYYIMVSNSSSTATTVRSATVQQSSPHSELKPYHRF